MNRFQTQAIFRNVIPVGGFHEVERDIWGPFVWSEKRFHIRLKNDVGHLVAKLCYYGNGETLAIRANGGGKTEVTLTRGWSTYPIDISGMEGEELEFDISRLIDIPEDSRELGLMIRWIRPVENGLSCDSMIQVLRNKSLNEEEFAQGRIVLDSFPTKLRINTATKCTMDPCCAYCDWDRTKSDEQQSDFEFDLTKLGELGRFYTLADEIVDNSYGEPLFYPHFSEFIHEFDRSLKSFEVGTNGLLLSSGNRKKLLGKEVVLYVSADASTAEGFNRYRKADFHKLINYLRDLCRERKDHNELPKVIMSYVAMKSNIDDLGPFMDLMKDVGVDGTKVIYLDPDPYLQQRTVDRDGFSFDYNAELLNWSELEDLGLQVKELAREKGTTVITRMDFGAEEAACDGPICSDPWKNIHVLDRGVVVCLFSRTNPLARWSERRGRSLERFLRDVWNDERYQGLRADLAQGRLPELCRKSLSCPLVRKRLQGSGNRTPTP